jgi:SNW domain-containing protein 1
MQQKLAQKEKAAKEEHLRLLAQRARDDRAGISAPAIPTKAVEKGLGGALGGYGSDSGSDDTSDSEGERNAPIATGGRKAASDDDEDDEDAREREKVRREKRQERERELRMNNMGNEQRAKMLAKWVSRSSHPVVGLLEERLLTSMALSSFSILYFRREQNRDISEKIALGLAKPSQSKETMIDSRLFNRESLSGSFASDDAYNLYDKPLFHGSAAAQAIYKPLTSGAQAAGEETYGGGTEEGVMKNLQNDRFALGVSRGFEGTEGGPGGAQPERDGPVQFEKDTEASVDPFGLDQFLDAAKKGTKRGGLDLRDGYVDFFLALSCGFFKHRTLTCAAPCPFNEQQVETSSRGGRVDLFSAGLCRRFLCPFPCSIVRLIISVLPTPPRSHCAHPSCAWKWKAKYFERQSRQEERAGPSSSKPRTISNYRRSP